MPKQKTHSSAKKRFKLTGSGKLLRRRAGQAHKLEKKSRKEKRAFRQAEPVSKANREVVNKLLGRR
jgi:large subunit ribosomal protein L35